MKQKTLSQIFAPVRRKVATRFAKPMPKQTAYKAEIMAFPSKSKSETITVLRIEHKEEKYREHFKGCYCNYKDKYPLHIEAKMEQVPLPSSQWFNYYKGYVFAFMGAVHCTKYFDSEVLEALHSFDYVASFYEIKRETALFCPTGVQCAFLPTNAKLIKRVELTELEREAA